ncbi:MAG: TolC family protein [Elusimicrobiota bacterium]
MKLLLFLFFIPSLRAEKYDIDSYVKKVLSVSNEIKYYEENLQLKKKASASAFAALYIPSAYYKFSSDLYSSSKKNFSLEKDYSSSDLIFSYDIFSNLSSSFDFKKSKIELDSANRDLWLKKQEVIYSAMKKYCDALKYAKLLEVNKASEKSYADEYEKSSQYYKEGLRSYSDLLKSKLNYKNAKLYSVYSENAYKSSLMELNYGIYEDPLNKNELSDISQEFLEKQLGYEEAVKYAVENRKELQNLKAEEKYLILELKKKTGDYLPLLNLSAQYSRVGIFNFSPAPSPKESYLLNLSLKIPFGAELFSKSENYNLAYTALERKRREITEYELKIKKEVLTLALELDYALEKYEVSKTNSEISKNNLEIIKQKYGEGKASVLELIEAQKDDLSAQSGLAESFYDLYLKRAEYKKALGIDLER